MSYAYSTTYRSRGWCRTATATSGDPDGSRVNRKQPWANCTGRPAGSGPSRQHRAPMTLARWIIRWGLDTSSNTPVHSRPTPSQLQREEALKGREAGKSLGRYRKILRRQPLKKPADCNLRQKYDTRQNSVRKAPMYHPLWLISYMICL